MSCLMAGWRLSTVTMSGQAATIRSSESSLPLVSSIVAAAGERGVESGIDSSVTAAAAASDGAVAGSSAGGVAGS